MGDRLSGEQSSERQTYCSFHRFSPVRFNPSMQLLNEPEDFRRILVAPVRQIFPCFTPELRKYEDFDHNYALPGCRRLGGPLCKGSTWWKSSKFSSSRTGEPFHGNGGTKYEASCGGRKTENPVGRDSEEAPFRSPYHSSFEGIRFLNVGPCRL
jgi:hypothetical protein